jgi:hypothetical protein
MRFWIRCALAIGAVLALSLSGCSSGSDDETGDGGSPGTGGAPGTGGTPGTGGSGGCAGNLDIAGGFEERYNCETDGVCTDDDVTIYLDIRIDGDDQDPSDGQDYTFCQTGGLGPLCIEDPPGTFLFSGSGTLCGDVFQWGAVSPDRFTETGTWTFFEEGDVFEKVSTYVGVGGEFGGECVGNGRRGGGAVNPGPCGEESE